MHKHRDGLLRLLEGLEEHPHGVRATASQHLFVSVGARGPRGRRFLVELEVSRDGVDDLLRRRSNTQHGAGSRRQLGAAGVPH